MATKLFDSTIGDAEAAAFIANILQSSTEYSLIGLDLDGKILLWNEGARQLYGLSQEWERMTRDKTPLSLIMCDIDFFKAYNDTFGHQAGDRYLQQIAKAISSAVKRPADLVARYGGEEFAVILLNTDREGALQVANEIKVNIRALEISHYTKASQYVTLSFGVASAMPTPETFPDILITNADKALYQAKAEGHDHVSLA